MTPAGTSNELDVQNEWEENTHKHTHFKSAADWIIARTVPGNKYRYQLRCTRYSNVPIPLLIHNLVRVMHFFIQQSGAICAYSKCLQSLLGSECVAGVSLLNAQGCPLYEERVDPCLVVGMEGGVGLVSSREGHQLVSSTNMVWDLVSYQVPNYSTSPPIY